MEFQDIEAQIADEIPQNIDRNRLKRSVNHVLDTISGVIYGIEETEVAVTADVLETETVYVLNTTPGSLRSVNPTSVVNSSYQWTQSTTDANAYYLEAAGGGDPSLTEPTKVYINKQEATEGSVTTGLSEGEYDWGDFDTIGFDTIYVRLSASADPDTQADGYVEYTTATDYFNFSTSDLAVGDQVWIASSDTNTAGYTVATIQETVVIFDTGTSLTAESVTSNLLAYAVTIGYTWDYRKRTLTLPSYLKELLKVFVDDEAFEKAGHEKVYDTDYSDSTIYASLSREQIKLTSGYMAGDGAELKIGMLRDLKPLTSTDPTAEIDIPAQLDQVFRSGVIYDIATQPQYRDEITVEKHQEQWNQGLAFAQDLELTRMPTTNYDRTFDYGP